MGWGDDFGSFEADMEAAAERESDAEQDEAMAEALEAFGGIGTGRPGLGFNREDGFLERSTTAQGGIGSGRPGLGFDSGFIDRSMTEQGIPGGRPGPGFDGYDYNDDMLDATGLLDPDFQSDFALSGTAPTYSGPSSQADIVNQEGRLDRWGNAIDSFFGMPQDVISQVDTFKEIDPTTGNVHHSDGRITDGTTGQTIQEPTRDWKEPWYMDRPNQGIVDEESTPEWDRDDTVAEDACVASGGTWDGGQCIMPSVDPDDDDDDNGDDNGYDPFASLTRNRQMFYHPMLETTAYSGERPDYVDENIWDYKPPQLRNWAGGLRKWASGD